MSYPFTTFPLVNRVGVTNPYAAVDARYGPWSTRNDALTSFNSGLRSQGLTLGIIESGKVVEYWYRDGVLDSNLVLKTPDINIAGYLPLSGGIISGNFSVSGTLSAIGTAFLENLNVRNILSSTYIQHINRLTLDSNIIVLKNAYPWLETSLFYVNSNASSITLKSGTDNNVGGVSISSLKLEVQSPIEVQNTLKVEGDFLSEKIAPSGSILFQDLFVETFITPELNGHIPNIGTNWTRIFQSNTSARIIVPPNTNQARPEFFQQFQGVIYQANGNYTSANYEVKTFLNEIAPTDVGNFDVFWLFGRIQNINNFYAVRFGVQSEDCVLFRRLNGTFTPLRQFSALNSTFRENLSVSLRLHNNNISVFFNDLLVCSVQDNSIASAGSAGIGVGNIGVRGNDSIDTRNRFRNFTVIRYSDFERDSYIFNNDFGVGTKTPNEKLTVSGNISSNNLIYALGGSSQDWNSNFTTVCTLSSQWNQSSNIIPTIRNYLSTTNVLVSAISVLSGTNSFQWAETYSVVSTNSAVTWNYQGTDVKNLTAKYESVFNTVQSNSATNWDETTQIIPTVTNYLSTNQVQVSSLISQNGVYDAGYFWDSSNAPNNNTWTDITYGNGIFVAIANSNVVTPNKIATSIDGRNWTLRTVPVQSNWVALTYGNGLFVAVADDSLDANRVLISSNGIDWTAISVPLFAWTDVAYGNGLFVAVANGGPTTERIMTSRDGISWTLNISNLLTISLNTVIFGNNEFIATSSNIIYGSSDGINWSTKFVVSPDVITSGLYGNEKYIFTTSGNAIYETVVNSNSLIRKNVNIANFSGKLYYANGLYFLTNTNGLWVSEDNINWNRRLTSSINGVVYGNGVFAAIGTNTNFFASGRIKDNTPEIKSPMYGGLFLYGNLTANNLVIASNGSSNLWTEVYSRVAVNSSTWNAAGSPNVNLSSIFATVCSLSTNWNSVYNTTCALSTNWSSVYSYWTPLTANTRNAVSFVNTNSANILNVNTKVNNTSGNWDSAYSQLCALSAKWNLPYDTALNINSTNAVENSAIAVKIQSLENGLNILVPAPTYNSPIALLTNFPNSVYEVGSTVNQTITLGFTQNDAGSATAYRLERNGFFLGQQTFGFSYNVNEIVVQGTTNYQNIVTYVDGPTKNNLLGLPDNRGRILAGNTSTARSYTGRFRQFFGSVSAVPTNLRTLTGNNFDDVNTFSFYAHQLNNILAIPATKSLQSAVTQNNETVTGNFALSSVFVNNANGVPVSYKRYVQTTNVPFNVNITFTLTTP